QKIRDACAIAGSHGYDYIWINTCRIDKTSSAELSQAITSMFDWYRLADVFYAFLHVVHDTSDSAGPGLSPQNFFESSWFDRGWTLQELIAPDNVVLLSNTWGVIGTKFQFAKTLEEKLKLDAGVLMGTKPLFSVSVAERMFWASARETTVVEYKAYCLLGIFGVSLTPRYGELRPCTERLADSIPCS
ncbi:hypothetical protein DICSQDRAFT_62630, partial [Dichomitus squalens LYAD-421 SS1]